MFRILHGLLAVLLLVLTSSVLAADAPVNLLANGSFAKTTALDKLTGRAANELKGYTNGGSTVLGAAMPDGWMYQSHEGTPAIGLDPAVTHGTSATLKMSNATPKNIGVIRLQDPVELKPKTRYLFSYYVKGETLVQDERKMGATSLFECRIKGATNDVKPVFAAWGQPLSGTFDWQRVELAFTTGDDIAVITNCQMQLRMVAGTAWFADLSLVETKNLLTNAGFEGWMPAVIGKRSPNLPDGTPIGWWNDKEANELGANPDFVVKATINRDTIVKHGGAYALRITNELPTDTCSLVFPPTPIAKSTSYKVRVWIKGEKIVPSPNGGSGVLIWMSTGPKEKFWENQVHIAKAPPQNKGDFDWIPFEFQVDAGATAEMAKVSVQLRRSSGTLWVDDVELVPVAAPAPLK